jgi:hypothetical protein
MNQKLENNQQGVVIENPPGTSDSVANNIEPPAQDLKHSYGDDSKGEEGISQEDEEDLETLMEKSTNDNDEPRPTNKEVIELILDLLNNPDYDISTMDKKYILQGALERFEY